MYDEFVFGKDGVNAVYFVPFKENRNDIDDRFITDLSNYFNWKFKDLETILSQTNFNNNTINWTLGLSRISLEKICHIFNIECSVNEDVLNERDLFLIRELNKKINEKIFSMGGDTKAFREYFYEYILGFDDKVGGIRYELTSFPKKIERDIRKKLMNQAQDSAGFQGKLSSEFSKWLAKNGFNINKQKKQKDAVFQSQIFLEINDIIQRESLSYGKNFPSELKTLFKNNNFYYEDFFFLEKDPKGTIKDKGKLSYKLQFKGPEAEAEIRKVFSNFMFTVLLKGVDSYVESRKKGKAFKNDLITFINKRKNILIHEFDEGLKGFSFNTYKDKKAITGIYGEAITAALFNSSELGDAVQQGGKILEDYSKQKPPSDLIITFNNSDKKVALQVKEWSDSFLESKEGGLGKQTFSYKNPQNKSYYYSNSPTDQQVYNLISFLMITQANFGQEEGFQGNGFRKNIAPLLTHLIPGFLRAGYVDHLLKNLLTNDLYLLTGNYVPAYFFIKAVALDDKTFSKRINGNDIYLQKETASAQEKRRKSFHNLLKKQDNPHMEKYHNALRGYQEDNNNLLTTFTGKAEVRYKGINLSTLINRIKI